MGHPETVDSMQTLCVSNVAEGGPPKTKMNEISSMCVASSQSGNPLRTVVVVCGMLCGLNMTSVARNCGYVDTQAQTCGARLMCIEFMITTSRRVRACQVKVE